MIRHTLINLNPVELNYYLFMVSLDKYSGHGNTADVLSIKICVPSITRDINVKVFNVITRINEAKTLIKHISCDCKCKFNSNVNANVNIIVRAKRILAGILAHVSLKW